VKSLLLLGMMVVALPAHGLEAVTPQGQKITARPMRDTPELVIQAARASGQWEGAVYVADHPEGSWWEVYLYADTATTWPERQSLYLSPPIPGRPLAALELFAMTPRPSLKRIPLPGPLVPKELWRGPRGEVILFARFPTFRRAPVRLTVTGGTP
jgi:hypothetical protein